MSRPLRSRETGRPALASRDSVQVPASDQLATSLSGVHATSLQVIVVEYYREEAVGSTSRGRKEPLAWKVLCAITTMQWEAARERPEQLLQGSSCSKKAFRSGVREPGTS